MFERDIVTLIHDTLGIDAYPLNVPSAIEPENSIVYKIVSNLRYYQATLGDYTLRKRTVRFTLLSKSYLQNVENSNALIATLDGYSGVVDATTFTQCRITNDHDLYNQSQDLHEKTIEVSFISKSDPEYTYPEITQLSGSYGCQATTNNTIIIGN